ncbi:uncharacterized protein LOC120691912 isoform X2 [Panicum virgatum]|nr:uncharacterized protein LOC120691912 isoform X2 [Panicum virgatum]
MMALQGSLSEGTGDWSDGWSKSSATAPPTIVMASCESQSAVSGVQGSSTDEASSMEGDTTSSSGGKRKWGVKRGWKSGVGSDSRAYAPGRVSPLEEALQHYSNRGSGAIIVPRVGLEFDSCEEAFEYYNLLSWEMGFGIQYSTNRTYKKNGETNTNMQLFVCACAVPYI